jgi:hypothetical protein
MVIVILNKIKNKESALLNLNLFMLFLFFGLLGGPQVYQSWLFHVLPSLNKVGYYYY